jgi:hypothetical protein
MPYTYAYLTGCLVLSAFWLAIFIKRRDLRREMLWASLVGMPFGVVDYFLIPSYWHPATLFGLAQKYDISIESFLFIAVMSGIVAVIYEFLRKEKLRKIGKGRQSHLWLLALITLAFLALATLFPTKAVYSLMLVGAAGAAITATLRPDLIKQMLGSAVIFSILYLGVFVLMTLLFRGLVESFYNLPNTWGVLVFGVPLEEIGVSFCMGAFWSTLYEYAKSYREVRTA